MFNDDNVAVDNLHTVLGWYELFPEFKTNDLYISGESYAGIYVPYLLNAIHHYNQVNLGNSSAFKPPVKGMMVGNGVTNWKYDGTPGAFEMAYWHSLIPKDLYDKAHLLGCTLQGVGGWPSEACQDIEGQFDSLFFSDDKSKSILNIYDIFGICWIGNTKTYGAEEYGLRTNKAGGLEKYKKAFTAADYTPWAVKHRKDSHENNLGMLPACTFGQPLIDYLGQDDVKKALHVSDSPKAWTLCVGAADGWHYTRFAVGSQWVWEGLKGRYRMLKYSGDTDAAVPTTGTRMWIDSMNRDILDPWRPYNFTNEFGRNETGGYVEEYEGLTLATIHGAGHMTPQFKPRETYHVIFRWLKGERI